MEKTHKQDQTTNDKLWKDICKYILHTNAYFFLCREPLQINFKKWNNQLKISEGCE